MASAMAKRNAGAGSSHHERAHVISDRGLPALHGSVDGLRLSFFKSLQIWVVLVVKSDKASTAEPDLESLRFGLVKKLDHVRR
jgi:hypothetical protein